MNQHLPRFDDDKPLFVVEDDSEEEFLPLLGKEGYQPAEEKYSTTFIAGVLLAIAGYLLLPYLGYEAGAQFIAAESDIGFIKDFQECLASNEIAGEVFKLFLAFDALITTAAFSTRVSARQFEAVANNMKSLVKKPSCYDVAAVTLGFGSSISNAVLTWLHLSSYSIQHRPETALQAFKSLPKYFATGAKWVAPIAWISPMLNNIPYIKTELLNDFALAAFYPELRIGSWLPTREEKPLSGRIGIISSRLFMMPSKALQTRQITNGKLMRFAYHALVTIYLNIKYDENADLNRRVLETLKNRFASPSEKIIDLVKHFADQHAVLLSFQEDHWGKQVPRALVEFVSALSARFTVDVGNVTGQWVLQKIRAGVTPVKQAGGAGTAAGSIGATATISRLTGGSLFNSIWNRGVYIYKRPSSLVEKFSLGGYVKSFGWFVVSIVFSLGQAFINQYLAAVYIGKNDTSAAAKGTDEFFIASAFIATYALAIYGFNEAISHDVYVDTLRLFDDLIKNKLPPADFSDSELNELVDAYNRVYGASLEHIEEPNDPSSAPASMGKIN